ncbi:MAG: polysaccharide deacetylase [Acidobacteria bacterium]|nr:MAG: polysaccharide deacetylase [Acidobacteriota bacterium]
MRVADAPGPGHTRIRSAIRKPLRRTIARLTRLTAPSTGVALRILTYHRVNDRHPHDRLTVSRSEFVAQMKELRATRTVIPLEDALAGLRGEGPLGERRVAITFDDGYRDNFHCALPILGEFGFPATFFVATGFIGTPSTFDRYRGCCEEDGMLDWAQVAEMHAHGHAIGGHGRDHLELAGLPAREAQEEIEGSRHDIEAGTGTRATLFCYPRGSETPGVRALVAGAGFVAACTVRPGSNSAGADLFGLRRTEISGDDDLADFRLKLDGAFDGWHRLVQRARAWTRA